MNTGKKIPSRLGEVDGANEDNVQAQDNSTAIKLDVKTAQVLISVMPPRANQARRLVKALVFNPDSPTNRLNRGSGVNLSDVALKYNKYLRPEGYFIKCRIPPKPIINAFGEKSGQELWGLYRTGGDNG